MHHSISRRGATIAQVAVDTLLLRPYCKYDLSADDHQPGDLIGLEHLKAAEAVRASGCSPVMLRSSRWAGIEICRADPTAVSRVGGAATSRA